MIFGSSCLCWLLVLGCSLEFTRCSSWLVSWIASIILEGSSRLKVWLKVTGSTNQLRRLSVLQSEGGTERGMAMTRGVLPGTIQGRLLWVLAHAAEFLLVVLGLIALATYMGPVGMVKRESIVV